MIRVIHLSDLHIHKSGKKADNQNAKAIVDYLCGRFKANKSKTYVVLTGDSVDDAAGAQYRWLQANILAPLRKRFCVLAAPGNHDYAFAGNLFDKRAPQRFYDYVSNKSFPCVTSNASEGVVFIGLDSGDVYNKRWFAEGVVGDKQRDKLRRHLKNGKFKDYFKIVYLHHHPFLREFGMALREHDELLRLLADQAGLVLFGHKHDSEAFFGRYHVPLMLASGKVTEPRGDALVFRVVEVEGGECVGIQTEEIEAAA